MHSASRGKHRYPKTKRTREAIVLPKREGNQRVYPQWVGKCTSKIKKRGDINSQDKNGNIIDKTNNCAYSVIGLAPEQGAIANQKEKL